MKTITEQCQGLKLAECNFTTTAMERADDKTRSQNPKQRGDDKSSRTEYDQGSMSIPVLKYFLLLLY